MSKNYFKMFIIFLIFILAMGVVSAEDMSADSNATISGADESCDNIQTDVMSVSNDGALELEVSDDDVLGQSNFDGLISNISSASSGGTVYIGDDITYDGSANSNSGMTISKSLTIDGQGHTISGNSKSTIFSVTTTGSVTFKNIIFTNVGERSVINIGTPSSTSTFNVNIINCTFYNPSELTAVAANSDSGAIFSYSQLNLDIRDSRFINGSGSTLGRGFYFNKTANVNVINSDFESHYSLASSPNHKYGSGAAMHFVSTSEVNIFNSTFRNNHVSFSSTTSPSSSAASGRGGAIYFASKSTLLIKNSTFDSNYAYSSSNFQLCGDGGAIYAKGFSSLEIINSTFENNHASNNGGAILVEDSSDYVKITDGTVFRNNYVESGSEVKTSNINNKGGGAISLYATDYLLINNSIFKDNYGLGSHGGALALNGISNKADIINSLFEGNRANATKSRTYTLENNYFMGNGGAISVYGTVKSLNINSTQFINNNATVRLADSGSASYNIIHGGGAIGVYVEDRPFKLSIFNSTFDKNNALLAKGSTGSSRPWMNGGAIYLSVADQFNISCSNFTNNFARDHGAIYAGNSNMSISDSWFENNTANKGGGIYLLSGKIVSNNTHFIANSAIEGSEGGGAIHCNHASTLEIYNSLMANNSALASGGSLYIAGTGTLKADNVTFNNNSAGRGAGIYMENSAETIIQDCSFENNTARNDGGAIQFITGGNIIFNNTSFVNSSANNGNTVTFNNIVNNVTFDNATFRDSDYSSSASPAGAVKFASTAEGVTFENSVFENIDGGSSRGGAVSFSGSTNVLFKNTTFTNVTAGNGVVSFSSYPRNITFTGVDLVNNTINNGAVYVGMYSENITFDAMNFIGNKATGSENYYASAIYISSSSENITVKNSNFTNNGGASNGQYTAVVQVLSSESGDITFENVNFTGSYCEGDQSTVHDIYSSASTTNIVNSTFFNTGDNEIRAVNIANYKGVLNINGSNFTNYRTGNNGAAIYTEQADTINCDNSNFINNSATVGGAIGYSHVKNFTVANSNFANNTAANKGGAFAVTGNNPANISFYNSSFENNHVVNGYGGAVYLHTAANSNVFKNLSFTGNYVLNGSGGAFYLGSNVHDNIFDSISFVNNSARNASFTNQDKYFAGGGGAIFIASADGNNYFKSLNFTDNYAGFVGGAIYQFGGSAEITGSEFTNNSAFKGGAIFLGNTTSFANISDSVFLNNKANATITLEYDVLNSEVIAYLSHNNNYIGAIYDLSDNITFSNVTYFQYGVDGGRIVNSGDVPPQRDNFTYHNVTLEFYSGDQLIDNVTNITDGENKAVFDFNKFDELNRVVSIHPRDNVTLYTVNDGIYSLGDFNILQNLVNSQPDNGLLVLNRSYTYTIGFDSITEGIRVGRNITIDGNGSVIDALGKSRIFYLFSDNVKLINITFRNAIFEGNGGAVYAAGVNNIQIRDSRFENCTALNGSAVYISGENSMIIASSFINNGYEVNDDGSDFEIGAEEVGNSTPTVKETPSGPGNDVSSMSAGGMNLLGDPVLDPFFPPLDPPVIEVPDNEFEIYTEYGGAVYINGSNASIRDSNFTFNGAHFGGAVYLNASDSVIRNVTFLQNEAEAGGALFSDAENMTVEDSSFIENSASGSLVLDYYPDWDFLINSRHFANKNECGGGAVYVRGSDSRIQKSRFYLNIAMDSIGGAVFWLGDEGKILDSNFTFNAAKFGAAVMWDCDAENALINNSVFDLLIDMGDLPEFVLGSNPHSPKDMGLMFNGENANYAIDSAIVSMDGANATVSYSTFSKNDADGFNAGINWFGDNGTLAYSKFSENRAYAYIPPYSPYCGSSLLWAGNDGNMSYSNFTNHDTEVPVVWYGDYEFSFDPDSMTINEGYEYLYGRNGIVDNCLFDNNTGFASSSIIWYGPDGTLSNSKFHNNTAMGPANLMWIGTDGVLSNLTFMDNAAFVTVCIVGYNISMADSTFKKNSVSRSAVAAITTLDPVDEEYVAFLNELNHEFYMDNCKFIENYGVESIIYVEMLDVVINNTDFFNNSAIRSVWVLANGTSIINSTFENNSAEIGIVVMGDPSVDQYNASIRDSRFTGNSVELGGAVTWFGTDGVIDNSNFTQNRHKAFNVRNLANKMYEVDIYSDVENQLNQAFEDWIYDKNSGAAVFWTGFNGKIFDSRFEQNNASSDNYHTYIQVFTISLSDNYGIDEAYQDYEFDIILDEFEGPGFISYDPVTGFWYETTIHELTVAKFENVIYDSQASQGGALYWSGGDGLVNGSTFANNSADYGGAAVIAGNAFCINGTNFTENRASEMGGAVIMAADGCDIILSEFYNNTAPLGGAVYNMGFTTISDSEFRYNKADNGSALYVVDDGLSIKSSTFLDNQAKSANITASFNVTENNVAVSVTFRGNDNLINAIYTENYVDMDNVKYWSADGVKTTDGSEEISDVEAGQNITLELYEEGILVTQMKGVTDINGNVNITIPGVRNGRFTAVASHKEDSYYTEIMESGEVTVDVTYIDIDIDIDDIYYRQNATAKITVDSNATGNITVQIDDSNFTNVNLTDKNGIIILDNISGLNAGIHYITVIYSGDENHTGCSETARFFVKQINSTVIISAEDGNYSDDIPVSVVVGPNDDESGKVILTIENEYGFILDITDSLQLEAVINTLDVGDYNITAYYTGDVNYLPSTNTTNFTVRPINLIANATALNVTVRQNTTFTLNVSYFNGRVNITVDGITKVVNITGTTDVVFDRLASGEKRASVTFFADSRYKNLTVPVNFKVSEIPQSFVNVSAQNITEGAVAQITVRVPDVQTGNVTITVNNLTYIKEIVNGTVKLNVTGLAPGEYPVNVTYLGNEIYEIISNSTEFNVSAKTTPVINIEAVEVIEVDGRFILNVTVTPELDLNVTINGEEIELVDGQYEFAADRIGSFTVVATTEENAEYNAGYNETTFTVIRHNASIADVSATPSVTVGQNTAIVVTMAEDNVTAGKILIEVNGMNYTVDIIDKIAKLNVTLPVGTYNATAYFLGDDKYNSDNKTSSNFAVVEKNVTGINITGIKVVEVDDVLVIHVETNSTESMTVRVNGKIAELDGNGNFTADTTAAGTYIVTVDVGEGKFWTEAFKNETYTVVKHNAAIESVDVTESVTLGENAVVNVTMANVSSGKLLIEINGMNYTVDINDFNATLSLVLPVGEYPVKVYYLGDEKYNSTENLSAGSINVVDKYACEIVISVDKVWVVDDVVVFEVTTNSTADLTVKVNSQAPNAMGNGMYNITADAVGVYTITAETDGNDYYHAGSNSTTFTVVKHNSTVEIDPIDTNYVDEAFTITVESNATVNVTINGKVYDVVDGTVNVDGLAAGEYTVVAVVYENAKYYGNITNATFSIVKYDAVISSVNVTESVTLGDNAEINVTLNVESGKLLIEINNMNYTVDINDFNATLSLVLPVGEYPVKVYYLGDDKYYGTENLSAGVINVADKYACEIVISVDKVWVVDDTVVFEVTTNSTAELTVKVNGEDANAMGNGMYNITVDAVGVYTITAETDGTDYYHAGSNSTTFTVIKHNSTVEIAPIDTYYVDEAFTITVESNATVNVTINGKVYDVVDGTVNVGGLAAGEYTVVAVVYENAKYNGNIANATFSIVKYDAVISAVNVTESVTLGDNAEINVTLNVESGKLLIEINNMNYTVDINDYSAELSLALPVGEYPVKVYYLGDDKYYGTENMSAGVINVVDKYACGIVISVDKVWVVDDTVIFEVTTNSTADLTVKVNGEAPNAMGNGMYNITVDAVGVYTITAETDGNDYYHAGSNSTTFTVIKHNSTVEIAPIDTHYVDEAFTITVESNATVNVTINGKAYEVVDGIVTVSGLDEGEYTVNAIVFENDKYLGNAANATFKVIKYASFVIVEADSITAGETAVIKVTAPDDTEAMVILYIGDINYEVDIVDGSGELKLNGLTQENYSIAALYLENDKYLSEINYTSFNVSKVDANASLDVEDSTVGEHAVITVTVPEDANGEVTVTVAGITKTVPVTGGENQIVIDGLPGGEHNVTAVYDGGDKYGPQRLNGTINVTPAKPDDPINHEVNVTIENVTSNSAVAVIEVADNMNGEVNITVDGKTFTGTVENGTAVVPLENLTPGKHDVSVIFEGDDNTVTTAQTTVDIPKEETEAKVSVEVDGDKATVTVDVPEDATGPVLIDIDGKGYYAPVEGGKAVLDITDLAPGDHTVKATYPGDDKYSPASDEDNFTVPKTSHEINVTAGENAVEVDVGDDINGTVTVSVDGKNYTAPVVNGKAVVPVDNLTPGAHEIEATVKGDDNTTSTAKTTVDVPKEEAVANVTVSAAEGIVTVELPEDATGVVLIDVDGKGYYAPVENGKAVLNITNLAPGDHTVKATYPGDDKYSPASDEDNFTVPKTSHDVNVTVGENAVEVDVGDEINGTVTVSVDGKNYTAPVVNGKAVVPVDNLTPGAHEIEATVKGDDNTASAAKTSVEIPKEDAPLDIDVNGTVITVDLPEDATGVVLIDVDGKGYYAPVENGKATVSVDKLDGDNHTVSAEYLGDDKYSPSNATKDINKTRSIATVIVVEKKFTRVANDWDAGERGAFFYGVLMDTDGNLLANKKVQIAVNGPIYNVTTDEEGRAGLQVNLANANTYTYALFFAGDEKYNASHIASTKLTVTKKSTSITASAKSFKASAKTKTVSVTLKTSKNPYDGKTYLSAGKKITLTVGGKTYTAKTDAKGVAKFNVKLTKKGTYTAKVSFAGDKTYSASSKNIKITIK